MTEEQVKAGKSILDKIDMLEGLHRDIDRLVKRTTEQKEEEISIKLNEQWIGTPSAYVSKESFIKYLNSEKHDVEARIQSLRDELERI